MPVYSILMLDFRLHGKKNMSDIRGLQENLSAILI